MLAKFSLGAGAGAGAGYMYMFECAGDGRVPVRIGGWSGSSSVCSGSFNYID